VACRLRFTPPLDRGQPGFDARSHLLRRGPTQPLLNQSKREWRRCAMASQLPQRMSLRGNGDRSGSCFRETVGVVTPHLAPCSRINRVACDSSPRPRRLHQRRLLAPGTLAGLRACLFCLDLNYLLTILGEQSQDQQASGLWAVRTIDKEVERCSTCLEKAGVQVWTGGARGRKACGRTDIVRYCE
jgi:hypothetical protein